MSVKSIPSAFLGNKTGCLVKNSTGIDKKKEEKSRIPSPNSKCRAVNCPSKDSASNNDGILYKDEIDHAIINSTNIIATLRANVIRDSIFP